MTLRNEGNTRPGPGALIGEWRAYAKHLEADNAQLREQVAYMQSQLMSQGVIYEETDALPGERS